MTFIKYVSVILICLSLISGCKPEPAKNEVVTPPTIDVIDETEKLPTTATEGETEYSPTTTTEDEKASAGSESPEWRIETAQITGVAAETENKDFERKNIHITNVEEYVREVIRPIYQEIVNSTNLTEMSGDGVTWYMGYHSTSQRRPIPDNISTFSSIMCVKYASGTDGNEYERRYYFDRLSDELVFALWTKNGMERRLYFYKSSVIRYIDENGTIVDNPTEPDILSMAETSLREGNVYWD